MKSLVLSIVFLLSALFMSGQIYVGPKIGLSGSQDIGFGLSSGYYYDGVKDFRQQHSTGNYGIEMMYDKSKNYNFKSELSYFQAGSSYNSDSLSYLQTRDYIKANLILAFGLSADDFKLMLQMGYYYSFLIQRNTTGAMPRNNNWQSWQNPNTGYSTLADNYRNDFGFSLGLSFSLAVGKSYLEINPRWEYGLVSHTSMIRYDTGSNNVQSSIDFRSQTLSINISYIIPVNK